MHYLISSTKSEVSYFKNMQITHSLTSLLYHKENVYFLFDVARADVGIYSSLAESELRTLNLSGGGWY